MSGAVTIGIDPGLDGAIAYMQYGQLVNVVDMPTFTIKVAGKMRRVIDVERLRLVIQNVPYGTDAGDIVVIEQQSTRPGQSAQSGLKTGIGYGLIIGVVVGLGHPYRIVTPKQWKKPFGLTDVKAESVALAAELWPDAAESFYGPRGGGKDGRAEAALIAEYHARSNNETKAA